VFIVIVLFAPLFVGVFLHLVSEWKNPVVIEECRKYEYYLSKQCMGKDLHLI
jgi:hypothetical protein